MLELYSYYRSSAAYRVRIGLNYKAVDYRQTAVNLLANEQQSDRYRQINPQGLVPALRFNQDMGAYPKIMAVYNTCNGCAAFAAAAPEAQPDAG
ncbi:MAG: glutathione S-transferase N-terminal domain-containing protein [Opitutales bacterium]|nr:glutathione S-transferase N-terminal domain-containing protein [Opitutales bacterium]